MPHCQDFVKLYAFAQALCPYGVRCVSLSRGASDHTHDSASATAERLRRLTLGRVGSREDVVGLIGTAAFAAAAALQRGMPTATRDEIQRLVEARMSRQAILTRDPPLRLWAIVDEAALHRPVGGRDGMRAQLERLAEAAELPQVTLQVVPYDVGGHPGMAGSFVILQFGEPTATDVAYIESQAGDLFLESETDVARFTAIFEHLRALSLPPEASASLITSIARER